MGGTKLEAVVSTVTPETRKRFRRGCRETGVLYTEGRNANSADTMANKNSHLIQLSHIWLFIQKN
jgi:hypothetical protein